MRIPDTYEDLLPLLGDYYGAEDYLDHGIVDLVRRMGRSCIRLAQLYKTHAPNVIIQNEYELALKYESAIKMKKNDFADFVFQCIDPTPKTNILKNIPSICIMVVKKIEKEG